MHSLYISIDDYDDIYEIKKSCDYLKIALDINTGMLVYYYVMRIDNLTNLTN